jgi:hypothetical protein
VLDGRNVCRDARPFLAVHRRCGSRDGQQQRPRGHRAQQPSRSSRSFSRQAPSVGNGLGSQGGPLGFFGSLDRRGRAGRGRERWDQELRRPGLGWRREVQHLGDVARRDVPGGQCPKTPTPCPSPPGVPSCPEGCAS